MVPLRHSTVVLEAGIDAALRSDLSIGLSYAGEFGPHSMDNGVRGNVTLKF
jgi:outer membrane autotransporter protein